VIGISSVLIYSFSYYSFMSVKQFKMIYIFGFSILASFIIFYKSNISLIISFISLLISPLLQIKTVFDIHKLNSIIFLSKILLDLSAD
jgi:hypothetical protein